MYKLAAIDLDGTMLNSYGVVSDKTKKVLQEKMNQGMDIMIASGRTTCSIIPIAEEINAMRYFIAGNGSIIYDMKNNEVIYDKFIPKQKILEIINICEENSIFYNIYTENEIITKNLKYNVLFYHKMNQTLEEEKRTKIRIVEDLKGYVENNNDSNYVKVMICDSSQLIFNSIKNKLKKVRNVEVLEVGHMSRKVIKEGTEEIPIEYYYTEVSLENVDKWNAIKYLIEKLGIQREEVIAIGDNVNDKNMIIEAGLGVAMGQSTPKVREIADIVTDSNDEDGVAKVLENL